MRSILFISIFVINIFTSQLFSQGDYLNFKNELAAVNDDKKVELYIEIINTQKTRSPQIAIKLANEALEEIKKENYPSEYAKIEYLLGDLYYLTGDYTNALAYLQQSVKSYEQLNDTQDLPLVYISIGRLYRKIHNDCENALNYYEKAESIYKTKNDLQNLATVYNYLGNVYHFCYQDYEMALSYYDKTKNYYEKVNDSIGLSYSLDFLSQVYGEQQDYERAIEAQTAALKLRLALKDSFSTAISYTNLGEIYTSTNDIQTALNNFTTAYDIAERNEFKPLARFILGKLSELSLNQKDYIKAYEYLKKQAELNDEILDEEKNKQLTEMKTKYETDRKEIALQKEIIKNKNNTLYLLLSIGAIIILITLILLTFQLKKSDKQKALITNLKNLESERTRIAKDLHDNLGAELTLISSKLDMKIYKSTNEAEINDLTEIRTISSNANNVLRETIWSIHKHELTVLELYQKVKEYTQRILEPKGIQQTISVADKEFILSPANALHLFRIIQEGVNNASKYSNCTHVFIHITSSLVEIKDNGKGFDYETVNKGYGLQNIKWRAEKLNGHFNISTSPGEGCQIRIEF